jgi:integrase
MLLQSFYADHFAPLFLRGRSPRTKALYESTIRTFSRHLGRLATLDDLTDDTATRFLSALCDDGYSPYTINKERDNLLAMWRFACRKGLVRLWPDVPPEIEPERVPQAWTEAEMTRLFIAIDRLKGWVAGVSAAAWWRALHLVAWDSGERISALMDVQWETVDLPGGWLLVPAAVRKGGKTDRLYKLADDTVAALYAIRFPPRDELFPWPFNRTYLWQKYEPILKAAGLPVNRHSKFHRIRRSVASHFEAAGGDATKLLGHSTRKVTKAYLDPRIVPEKQACDLLFRPWEKGA